MLSLINYFAMLELVHTTMIVLRWMNLCGALGHAGRLNQ